MFFVQRIILKEKYLEELLETNFLGRKTIFLSKCKMKKKPSFWEERPSEFNLSVQYVRL